MVDIRGAISRGADEAETMAEERFGDRFDSINWFKLADKGVMYVRWLDDHDEWFNVRQHPYATTRPAPDNLTEEQKKRWPKMFNPVCRKTKQFVAFFPDGCYICDEMHKVRPNKKTEDKGGKWFPQLRHWARCVEREEVYVTTEEQVKQYGKKMGEFLGYRDIEDEVDELDDDNKPTGKKIMKKRILVVNQPWKNFFGKLKGFGEVHHTLLDRDYRIKRAGADMSTDYSFVALEPVRRPDGSAVDMRDPEIVDDQPTGRQIRDAYFDDAPDIIRLIEDRLSDDVYLRFFDDRVPVPERKSDGQQSDTPAASSNGSAPVDSPPADSPPQDSAPVNVSAPAEPRSDALSRLAEMRADMRSSVKSDHPPQNGEATADASATDEPSEPAGEPVAATSGPVAL